MNTTRSVAALALALAVTLPVLSPSSVSAGVKIGPGERRCFTVAGEPGDAAVVNLTAVLADGAGNGKLISSDVVDPSESSNVNFRPGTADPNVAIAPIGQDGRVCYVNSDHAGVHLVADHLGTIDGDVYTSAVPTGEVERILDTRWYEDGWLRPGDIGCGGIDWTVFPVADRDAAAFVNITPVWPDMPGHAQFVTSLDAPPSMISNVNFVPGTVNPNVGVTTFVSFDDEPDLGYVCILNSEHANVDMVLDLMGWVDRSVYRTATEEGTAWRSVETRFGGSRIEPDGRLCFGVTGEPGDAAIVNLTPVGPSGPGNAQLVSSDVTDAPEASNVNFRPGLVDPNVAIAPIGEDGGVCFVNSEHASVDLVADHLGTISADAYTPASPTGAPVRVIDTRQ